MKKIFSFIFNVFLTFLWVPSWGQKKEKRSVFHIASIFVLWGLILGIVLFVVFSVEQSNDDAF